jgi:hypothetical protein
MSDIDSSDGGLPPKLNLTKKTLKPTAIPVLKPVVPAVKDAAGAPAVQANNTSRIKLTAKPTAKLKPIAISGDDPSPAAPIKAAPPPTTVRLQAKLKPVAAAAPVTAAAPKPITDSDGKSAALKPKSIKLKAKPAMGIKRSSVDKTAPKGSKHSTSKIPLGNANSVSPIGETINTKTIKIKPSSDEPSANKAPLTIKPAAGAKVGDSKSQTSRISLEAALGTDSDSATTGPKTIRLKRPGKTPSVKVNKIGNKDKDLGKTSKIELPDSNSDVPDTQKKTIKVKRPSQRRKAKTMSVKRKDDEAPAEGIPITPLSDLTAQNAPAPDTVHWTFIVSSIAAVLVACVLIYVMCAQVFGPNISLTKLAYWGPTVELPWPGRIN